MIKTRTPRRSSNGGSWNKPKEIPAEESAAPLAQIPADLEGKKAYLQKWFDENRIPGKIQSWFSVPSKTDNADWRIVSRHLSKGHRILTIEGPFKGARPPKLVLDIDQQIRKPHLSKFRGSILQIWFRSTGDGRFGIAVQNILHSAEATREFKSFLDYLEHEHSSDVLCCHQMQVRPVQLLDPSMPQTGVSVELKKGFGSPFLPIAGSGQKFHILDWTPTAKEPWLRLPTRIREAIHPAKDDKFLECFAGPAFIATSLAKNFSECFAADQRDIARQTPGVRYLHAAIDRDFFPKFFRGKSKQGKWTVYLDPPNGKSLPSYTISALAEAAPERILLNTSNLAQAALEIKRFRREGYMLRKLIPLDLEPETPTFQILLLFVPDRAGLLGRKPERTAKVIREQENQTRDSGAAVETIRFTQKRRIPASTSRQKD